MKLRIKTANVIEGDLYERFAEDEKIFCYNLYVECVGSNWKVYRHKKAFYGAVQDEEHGFWYPDRNAKKNAHKLLNRIIAKGEIDTKHWHNCGSVPDPDEFDRRLEEAWSDISDHFEDYY